MHAYLLEAQFWNLSRLSQTNEDERNFDVPSNIDSTTRIHLILESSRLLRRCTGELSIGLGRTCMHVIFVESVEMVPHPS